MKTRIATVLIFLTLVSLCHAGADDPLFALDGGCVCVTTLIAIVARRQLDEVQKMVRVVPAGLGGTFTWTQHCCGLTGYGNQFWWAHERPCWCGGCYASGWYSYEGYALECTGGYCGCPYYDDDDPYESEEDDGPYAAGAYKQVFDISANGTVKITKHDHWIERNTNEVIRLDGVEVHDGGHRR